MQDGEVLDKAALMQAALTGQMKERMELERKLQSLGKRMDHYERAKREAEAPLLEQAYQRRLEVGFILLCLVHSTVLPIVVQGRLTPPTLYKPSAASWLHLFLCCRARLTPFL